MITRYAPPAVTALALVILSACGISVDGTGADSATKRGKISCESIFGGGSKVVAAIDQGCAICTTSDVAFAADGDLSSFANVSVSVSVPNQGVTIRATAQPGLVFPAGNRAGVFFNGPAGPVQTETGGNGLSVRTYLGGQLQESPSDQNLYGTLGGNPYSFQSFQATLPFDAVEVFITSLSMTNTPFELNEICSNGSPE